MLAAVRIWILLSTLVVGAGWILSALHQLNRVGYAIVFVLAGIAGIVWCKKNRWPSHGFFLRAARKLLHRGKRPLPLLFLTLALLALVAGALYAPSNNDSNEYRIPRVLHWLGAGQWNWIHTLDDRMNIAGCGFEWLSAPIMLFTHTDRFIFLINWISYLLLPGLIFSVFTRLGVRPRAAWWWMWLLASGWCFVFQAGSDANDSFAVIYALAAVDLALRAREKNCLADLWLSLMAAALLTGTKQTSIPLAALWLVAALPGARLFLTRPWLTIFVAAIGLLVSAAPLIYFNLAHTNSWAGISQTSGWAQCVLQSPFWGVVGNAFCLPLQNLQPPYFPASGAWNDAMQRFVQSGFGAHFASFERFGRMSQGVSEANAGIGLWMVILTLISIWGVRHYRPAEIISAGKINDNCQRRLLRLLPWLLLLLFMAKVGTYANARQFAPYYVFLFPVFLISSGHANLVRHRWWQMSGLLAMLLTAGLIIVARNRPLFPAETILVPLKENHPNWKFLAKAWDSYATRLSVEAQRNIFKSTLPSGQSIIGYTTVRGSREPALWLPFGSRRVQRILPGDALQQLQSAGINYAVVDGDYLDFFGETIGDWTAEYRAVVIDQLTFETEPGKTARSYLVRLPPATGQ